MKRFLFTAATVFFLLGGASTARSYDSTTFGALETMSATTAKAKLTAWLKEVGKSDAATLRQLEAIWSQERSILDRVAETPDYDFGFGAEWNERIATGVVVAVGVMIVAMIAVLMGMA